MAINTSGTTTVQHDKDHYISDHNHDGSDVLVGASGGNPAEIDWSHAAATALTVAIRDANGDLIVPATPTNDNAAVSKVYAEGLVSGLQIKDACSVATAAALPAYTGGGTGTLTATSVGVLTIDGIATVLGDRILLKDGASAIDNGIYEVTTEGTVGVAYVLTRTADLDTGDSAANAFTFVGQGTANGETGWACTSVSGSDTVDTHALTWVQFNGGTTVTGGDGIRKTGTSLDIEPTDFAGNGLTTTGAVPAQDMLVEHDVTTGGNIQPVNVAANGVGVDINAIAGTGIEADGSANLRLALQGNGIAGGAGSTLSVDADTETGGNIQGANVTANGVGVDVSAIAGNGLAADGSANLDVSPDTTGGANLAEAINVSANGVAVKIDDVGVKENGSGQLVVAGFHGFGAYAGSKPTYTEAHTTLGMAAVNDWAFFLKAASNKVYLLIRQSVGASDITDFSMVQMT